MEQLLQQVECYVPCNAQEKADKALLLHSLRTQPDILTRQNRLAHVTASAWVVNESRTKVLMVYHNLYNSWSWMGGHADGQADLLAVAMREVQEESGLVNVRPLQRDIFSLEVLTVDGHVKRGEYVSSHLHLNVTYLLQASEQQTLCAKPDENSGVAWYELQQAVQASSEPWFRQHVYPKLNEKLSAITP